MSKPPKAPVGRVPSASKLNRMLGLQSNDVLQRPHLMELAKNHPSPVIRQLATSVIKIKKWDKMNPIVRAQE